MNDTDKLFNKVIIALLLMIILSLNTLLLKTYTKLIYFIPAVLVIIILIYVIKGVLGERNKYIKITREEAILNLKKENYSVLRYWRKIFRIFKFERNLYKDIEKLKILKNHHEKEEIKYMKSVLEGEILFSNYSTNLYSTLMIGYVTLLVTSIVTIIALSINNIYLFANEYNKGLIEIDKNSITPDKLEKFFLAINNTIGETATDMISSVLIITLICFLALLFVASYFIGRNRKTKHYLSLLECLEDLYAKEDQP